MRRLLLFLLLILPFITNAQTVTPEQARKFMGQDVTVCGLVTSSRFVSQTDGHPTYLGFGNIFPNQIFSIVIMENDLVKFSYNAADLKDSKVCVKGKVEMYGGKPSIIVTDESQIDVQTDE